MRPKSNMRRRVTRKIKRFFKSRRGRLVLIGALALGTAIIVASQPSTRQIVIGCWSRFNRLFNSINKESTTSIPLVETSSKSNPLTWKQIGLFGGIVVILGVGLWSGKIELDDFNFLRQKDEVVRVPSKSFDPSSWNSYPLPVERRGWIIARTVGGASLVILSIPVMIVTQSYEIASVMQLTGWQMATWPITT